jgi:sporadic carbohydrate cluster 2OG-Fe(II) oxygenase
MNFFTNNEKKISSEFLKKGYIIKKIEKIDDLIKIKKIFEDFIIKTFGKKISKKKKFDDFGKFTDPNDLNNFRLNLINYINSDKNFRFFYYNICKDYLDVLVGNELVMQNNINLSIQVPNDSSSLLPLHSDVWSGDSPFEIVVWLPLVDCYKTKSMYILKPEYYPDLINQIKLNKLKDSEKLFKYIKNKIEWLQINYGEILIFNQSLPHGNRVNKEKTTRWSMNCRFKSIFSPYGDKKLGEFFSPITTRPMTELGMNYSLPNIENE